jgi:hypothetical protein
MAGLETVLRWVGLLSDFGGPRANANRTHPGIETGNPLDFSFPTFLF